MEIIKGSTTTQDVRGVSRIYFQNEVTSLYLKGDQKYKTSRYEEKIGIYYYFFQCTDINKRRIL